ncbi:MAG TPA: topoisomerase C-terminal repeat-containing protein, partial [Verrucomicrobiae bacterium]|nr:topoisomerase C-terminal repeat-containing protein [Verrucomicrobiae bacterium]
STRITRVVSEPFKTEGKVLVNPGWLEIYGRQSQSDDEATIALVAPNEAVATRSIEVAANVTKPPPRYSEATLLSAMEGAGKLIEDEELRAAMSAKGLGTPATRAAIIDGLIYEKYLLRLGKELQPTAKAFSLIILLRGLSIPELSAPELTGNWEYKLKQMEQGQLTRTDFMAQIQQMTRDIIEKTKLHESDTVPGDFATLQVPCPKCGGVIKENYKKFQCQNCDFALWKIVAGRQFEIAEVEELITKRTVGPLQGFRSKMGKPFAGLIKLTAEFKPEFDFGQTDGNGEGPAAAVDFSGQESVGKCPKCGNQVFEHGMSFVCEKAVGPNRTCDFRSGKVILQQTIDRAQMVKLLSAGKTDLLPRFISKKGRPFEAFLVVGKDGKVGFEFKPREAKTGKAGAKGAKSKEPAPKVDFTGLEPIGKCPRCGARVFDTEQEYLCENTQAETKKCKFRAGKMILHQPVERAQMEKLLARGKTDLLDKFVSRAGRPFSAYLVVDDEGKVTFEFPPREGQPAEA